jgi:hypothetical protein
MHQRVRDLVMAHRGAGALLGRGLAIASIDSISAA